MDRQFEDWAELVDPVGPRLGDPLEPSPVTKETQLSRSKPGWVKVRDSPMSHVLKTRVDEGW